MTKHLHVHVKDKEITIQKISSNKSKNLKKGSIINFYKRIKSSILKLIEFCRLHTGSVIALM